jgi:hypothetical protein
MIGIDRKQLADGQNGARPAPDISRMLEETEMTRTLLA